MMLLRSLAALSLFTFLLHGTSFAAAVGSAGDEWERTVKAAEQEGQVTVYKLATDAEFLAFQKRYPKIKLNLVTGSGSQILQRIMAERRAGKYLADVVRTGGGTAMTMLHAKAFDPIPPALIMPEVKDVSKWFDGKHHYNDGENRYIFVYAAFPLRMVAYNTKLVDPKSLTSFWDLLDPEMERQGQRKIPTTQGC
jgi:ABC-type glycerol-3-phosphate transport system substrate-binding protein